MVRAFIAVGVPESAKRILGTVIQDLKRKRVTGVRWVNPKGIHATLKFLGDIEPESIERIMAGMDRACRGSAPLTVRLSGAGAFPNTRGPKVLWVGLSGDMAQFKTLQTAIDSEMHSVLGLDIETRRFNPHLTLGRVREGVLPAGQRDIGKVLESFKMKESPAWTVDRVHLIQSTLTPDGPIYETLGSRMLRATDSRQEKAYDGC